MSDMAFRPEIIESPRGSQDFGVVEKRDASAAEVIDPPTSGDRVTFASTVLLEDENGKKLRYQIVGSDETDPSRGRISIMAPLARTLIGKKVGDSVVVALPAGKKRFEILEANFPWPSAEG